MNRSIEILKETYKPYKITKKGQVVILNSTSGDLIVKEKNIDIYNLYQYLKSRSFDYFPKLVEFNRDDVNVFEYVKGISMPIEQKALDLTELIALLHNKTSYYKEVTGDTYKAIYDNVKANIIDLKSYYSDLFDLYVLNDYNSPSEYLFLRNYYEINNCLNFCNAKIEEWYILVKDKHEERVSLIHNNLELDHFIKGDKDYLISWDKAVVDSPILDMINFYRKEFYNLHFNSIFSTYFNNFELKEEEKQLLFICISIPDKITIDGTEYEKCMKIGKLYDYIFKTEEVLKPYYSEEKKTE
ncbi:MAG: hypothetical protein ACI31M_01775 [Bacilli bacterium]